MTNEAVIIELPNGGEPINFTVGDGAALEKGTILRLLEPRTVSASTGVEEVFAGIAASEKVANDGSTTIGAYTKGIFDLKLATNSTCQAGDLLVISGANLVAAAATVQLKTDPFGNSTGGAQRAMQSGMIIGKALETGSSAEVIAVQVGIY